MDHYSSVGIDRAQVGSFEQIALLATPRQILGVICPTVLSGDDVIEMEGGEGQIPLVNSAVFAAEAGLASNSLAGRLIH